ncbi:hypothetical protein N1851_032642 [Merluccius polli]|uniref:Uncharacterized protein n=1 Tax=Merluccius polli TaxID=89951 RepID=A0AA47M2M1_MERPO|nr:hypothetical protein N1851_032642 [Merluccius polli]
MRLQYQKVCDVVHTHTETSSPRAADNRRKRKAKTGVSSMIGSFMDTKKKYDAEQLCQQQEKDSLAAWMKSLRNKIDELQGNVSHLLDYMDVCLMAFTEKWLKDSDTDSSLDISGFQAPGPGQWCSNITVPEQLCLPTIELLCVGSPRRDLRLALLTITLCTFYPLIRLLRWEKVRKRQVKMWTEDSSLALQGCFDCTDWSVFMESSDNIDELTDDCLQMVPKLRKHCTIVPVAKIKNPKTQNHFSPDLFSDEKEVLMQVESFLVPMQCTFSSCCGRGGGCGEVVEWWLRMSTWASNQRGALEMNSPSQFPGDGIGRALCSPVMREGEQRRGEFRWFGNVTCWRISQTALMSLALLRLGLQLLHNGMPDAMAVLQQMEQHCAQEEAQRSAQGS